MAYKINRKALGLYISVILLALASCGKSDAELEANKVPIPTDQDILNGIGNRQSIGPAGVTIQSPEGHMIGG